MLQKGGNRKIFLALLTSVLIIGTFPFLAFSQPDMTSTNYKIWESSVNSGGTDVQTSTSYGLRESIGEAAVGEATSTSYRLKMGYQPMLESYLSLSVSTDSIAMLPSINGVAGGTATGTFSATVITDNPAGYSLYFNASTSPAFTTWRSSSQTVASRSGISRWSGARRVPPPERLGPVEKRKLP